MGVLRTIVSVSIVGGEEVVREQPGFVSFKDGLESIYCVSLPTLRFLLMHDMP